MPNKGEVITKDRIGFEKTNKALGLLYKNGTNLPKSLSEIDGINIELDAGKFY